MLHRIIYQMDGIPASRREREREKLISRNVLPAFVIDRVGMNDGGEEGNEVVDFGLSMRMSSPLNQSIPFPRPWAFRKED